MSNRIMKKTLASALAIISAATFVPSSVIGTTITPIAITASAEVVSGNYTYEELSDGTISITKYTGTESKVEIPEKINGKTVSKIGNQAFMGNKNITEVSCRNDALTSIGEFAFCSCTSLKTVLIRSDASKQLSDAVLLQAAPALMILILPLTMMLLKRVHSRDAPAFLVFMLNRM